MNTTRNWWGNHETAKVDRNSKDGLRHYTTAEREDYKQKVFDELKKQKYKKETIEDLWTVFTRDADIEITMGNNDPKDLAMLLTCDHDDRPLSEIIPAFVSSKTTKEIQSEAEKEAEAAMQQEAIDWINNL